MTPHYLEEMSFIFYNKFNKLQIKILWVFINYNKVLGSIKNKKFLNFSRPFILYIYIFLEGWIEPNQDIKKEWADLNNVQILHKCPKNATIY